MAFKNLVAQTIRTGYYKEMNKRLQSVNQNIVKQADIKVDVRNQQDGWDGKV